jgi:UDP-glucose 4-epimerase
MLRDLAAASQLRYVALRYFNVAGSDPGGRIGHTAPNATLLVKVACQHAAGVRPSLQIFGTDYPTPDGTAVRDYVHVRDLAAAHLAVLPKLDSGSVRYNVGNGAGHSVKQVIAAIEKVSGRAVPHSLAPRRAGDPPALVASSQKLRGETGWQPRHANLEEIVRTAWAWHVAHPKGYGGAEANSGAAR